MTINDDEDTNKTTLSNYQSGPPEKLLVTGSVNFVHKQQLSRSRIQHLLNHHQINQFTNITDNLSDDFSSKDGSGGTQRGNGSPTIQYQIEITVAIFPDSDECSSGNYQLFTMVSDWMETDLELTMQPTNTFSTSCSLADPHQVISLTYATNEDVEHFTDLITSYRTTRDGNIVVEK